MWSRLKRPAARGFCLHGVLCVLAGACFAGDQPYEPDPGSTVAPALGVPADGCWMEAVGYPFLKGFPPVDTTIKTYPFNTAANWVEIPNWIDSIDDTPYQIDLDGDSNLESIPRMLNPGPLANSGQTGADLFNFTDSATWPRDVPQGEKTHGPAILMADPTIAWIDDPGDSEHGYYYITGTTGQEDDEQTMGCDESVQTANFAIYRTRDLVHFEQVGYAFDNARRRGRVIMLHTNDGRHNIYSHLVAPHLIVDHSDEHDPQVYISFVAVAARAPDSIEWANVGFDDIIKVPHWRPEYRGIAVNPLLPIDNELPWSTEYTFGSCGGDTSPTVYDQFASGATGYDWTDRRSIADHVCASQALDKSAAYASVYIAGPISASVFAQATAPVCAETDGGLFSALQDGDVQIRWYAYGIPDEPDDPDTSFSYWYDGGQQASIGSSYKAIPSSGAPHLLNGANPPLMLGSCWTNRAGILGEEDPDPATPIEEHECSCELVPGWNAPLTMAHRTNSESVDDLSHCLSPSEPVAWAIHTVMEEGPFMFWDKRRSKAWMLYNYTESGTEESWRGPGVENMRLYGNNIAGAPLNLAQPGWFMFDHQSQARQFAYRINSNNKVSTWQPGGVLDEVENGMLGTNGLRDNQRWGNCEGASAVYFDGRYYLFYTRNRWRSAGYSTLYRFTEPPSPTFNPGLKHLWLTDFEDAQVEEDVLVSSKFFYDNNDGDTSNDIYDRRAVYISSPVPGGARVGAGRSYGHGEVFFLRHPNGEFVLDDDGRRVPYFIYHAKGDQLNYRTLFFKRLWVNPTNGKFAEIVDNHRNKRRDGWVFTIPARHCIADWNRDGYLTIGDRVAFKSDRNRYNNFGGNMGKALYGYPDLDRDGDADADDLSVFDLAYEVGCGCSEGGEAGLYPTHHEWPGGYAPITNADTYITFLKWYINRDLRADLDSEAQPGSGSPDGQVTSVDVAYFLERWDAALKKQAGIATHLLEASTAVDSQR